MKIILIRSDQGWSVSAPSLPDCHSQGRTQAEAIDNIKVAVQEYLAVKADLAEKELPGGAEVRHIEIAV